MSGNGSLNIKEKEIVKNNLLAKDVNVFKENLVLISQQIEEKKKELIEVNRQIDLAKGTLVKIQAARNPLITVLDKKETELSQSVAKFELEVLAWDKRSEQSKLDYEKKIISQEKLIKEKTDKVKEVQIYIDELLIKIEQLKSQEENYNSFLKVINKKIKEAEDKLKILEERIKVKEYLEEEIAALKRDKKYLLAEGESLAIFSRELDEREKVLEKEISKALLLQQRLKPKYIKIFKQYANLK